MIEEKVPQYMLEFKSELFTRMDRIESSINEILVSMVRHFGVVYNKIDQIEARLDSMDERFNGIDDRFDIIENRLDSMEIRIVNTEETTKKIESHIGRYEVRSQNIEQILLQDHKPRIIELEKETFRV